MQDLESKYSQKEIIRLYYTNKLDDIVTSTDIPVFQKQLLKQVVDK